ncbi:hypothetical protein V6Z11_A07G214000 [Gossypium hirsutum]
MRRLTQRRAVDYTSTVVRYMNYSSIKHHYCNSCCSQFVESHGYSCWCCFKPINL